MRSLSATAELFSSISGSRSSPDEFRLIKHLFYDQHEDSLLTTPLRNISDHVVVGFSVILVKLIALVKSKDLILTVRRFFVINNY